MQPSETSFLPFSDFSLMKPTDSLFLAVVPDADAYTKTELIVRELRASDKLRGKQIPADRAHITLNYFGDFSGVPASVVKNAELICSAVAAQVTPFEVRFDRVKSYPGKYKNPLVLCSNDGNGALMELHRRLVEALGALCKKSKFDPHLTLLYDEQMIEPRPVASVSWTVHEIVLVHSLLSQSRHIPLWKVPLLG